MRPPRFSCRLRNAFFCAATLLGAACFGDGNSSQNAPAGTTGGGANGSGTGGSGGAGASDGGGPTPWPECAWPDGATAEHPWPEMHITEAGLVGYVEEQRSGGDPGETTELRLHAVDCGTGDAMLSGTFMPDAGRLVIAVSFYDDGIVVFHYDAETFGDHAVTWFDSKLGAPTTVDKVELAEFFYGGSRWEQVSPAGRILIRGSEGLEWLGPDGSTESTGIGTNWAASCIVDDDTVVIVPSANGEPSTVESYNLSRNGIIEKVRDATGAAHIDVECFPRQGRFTIVEENEAGTESSISFYDAAGVEMWSATFTGDDEINLAPRFVGPTDELWATITPVFPGTGTAQVQGPGLSVTLEKTENSVGASVSGHALVRTSPTGSTLASRVFPPSHCFGLQGADAHSRAFGWCDGLLRVLDENLDPAQP